MRPLQRLGDAMNCDHKFTGEECTAAHFDDKGACKKCSKCHKWVRPSGKVAPGMRFDDEDLINFVESVTKMQIPDWQRAAMKRIHKPKRGGFINPGIAIKPTSANRKLSPVDMVPNTTSRLRPVPVAPFCSSTYVSIATSCPDLCPFKKDGAGGRGGCYAEAGFTGSLIRTLDTEAAEHDIHPAMLAGLEADAINKTFPRGVPQDGARGGRDLRLHIAGDVIHELGATILANAARRWQERGGGSVWTYTHSWRTIPRKAWGPISVFASVEDPCDIEYARERDYPAALVVEAHPSAKAYHIGNLERNYQEKVIPCPAETKGVTCVECRLCLDRDMLTVDATIGFAVHGVLKSTALVQLGKAGGIVSQKELL